MAAIRALGARLPLDARVIRDLRGLLRRDVIDLDVVHDRGGALPANGARPAPSDKFDAWAEEPQVATRNASSASGAVLALAVR